MSMEPPSSRSPTASARASETRPMTPVSMRPPIMTNRPAKKARVGHSTSASTSLVCAVEIATSRPAPSSATMLGAKSSTGWSTNPAMTRVSTVRPWASMRGSRIASRSLRSMTSAARCSSWTNAGRNITRARPIRTRTRTADSGARWTRKSLKVRPARLPMMMFGGSPTSVAIPPMLEANTSTIRKGAAGRARRSHTSSVTGAIEQHGGDVVQQGRGGRGDDDEHHHHAEGPAAGSLDRPDRQVLEQPGAPQHSDDHHHAHEQEDDVPVDPGVHGVERRVGVGGADEEHQPGAAESGGDPVHLLTDDQRVGAGEDGDGRPAVPVVHATSLCMPWFMSPQGAGPAGAKR